MSIIKSVLALSLVAATSTVALADEPAPAPITAPAPTPEPLVVTQAPATPVALASPAVATASAEPAMAPVGVEKDDGGWKKPVGRRFMHGFRLGYTNIRNFDKKTREGEMSIKEEFDLKTPHMMLLGYEGFYRVIGQSWLNVLIVGNVSIAGLEQSKFIPAASGLIGFEFDQSFQVGVGVNLTPDPQAPTHMIAAAGWTPRVGSIHTPLHFFIVPDTEGNHRWGTTIGMTW